MEAQNYTSYAQQPMQPEKIHVHHSYIWLGGLRIAFYILFVAGVSFASSLIGLITELHFQKRDAFSHRHTFAYRCFVSGNHRAFDVGALVVLQAFVL